MCINPGPDATIKLNNRIEKGVKIMTGKTHRPGVNAANLVTRHLKLEPVDATRLREVEEALNTLAGMDAVGINAGKGSIRLTYDATGVSLEAVEALLVRHQLRLRNSWWTRFKHGYYRFIEQNVRDNAKHVHTCCHKPPAGAGK